MRRKLKIFSAKIVASCETIINFLLIKKYRKEAYGDKKSASTILKELLVMIWRDYAYLTILRWDAPTLIRNYFVERIYLKSVDVDEYMAELPAILIVRLSSSMALKRISILDNKETFWQFMNKHNLPVTERLGYIKIVNTQPVWETPTGEKANLSLLFKRYHTVFVKTADGTQGYDCALWKLQENGSVCVNNVNKTLAELEKTIQHELLVECVVRQHNALSVLYPHSLNTLRIVTLRDSAKKVVLGSAILRMGTGGAYVDNFNFHGVGVAINSDGRLGKVGHYKDFTKAPITHHPDTHVEFKDYTIPYYQQAIDLALKAHALNKGLSAVGWDIAITENGPLFIEANPMFGFELLQIAGGGYRTRVMELYLPIAKKFANQSDILV